jgi:small acid-soluble spore protein H (minor)
MDERRANEIASSPVMANVTYNGMQIFIENVNEKNGTASIHALDHPKYRQEVALTSLIEH